ncbi:MAG: phosphatase PAP2 family protein [Hyphomicrobiales bacterium]
MKGRAPNPPGGQPWLSSITVTILAVAIAYLCLDEPVARGLRTVGGDPTGFFRAITDVGLAVWYLVPSGALILLAAFAPPLRVLDRASARLAVLVGRAAYLFVAVGGVSLLMGIVKRGIGRARPKLMEKVGAFDFVPMSFDGAYASFPSGHATTVGAAAVALSFFFPRWRLPIFFAAILVALSRVMVGAHFPSDVIAGFTLGAAAAWVLAAWLAREAFGLSGCRRRHYKDARPPASPPTGRHRRRALATLVRRLTGSLRARPENPPAA